MKFPAQWGNLLVIHPKITFTYDDSKRHR
jgi:hypothetical protein